MENQPTRCGFIAVIGAPNAGKSTLVNQIIGAKVSIVSPKVQTTRTRVTGILAEGSDQAIFVDTPGIFRGAKRRLEKAMVDLSKLFVNILFLIKMNKFLYKTVEIL